MDLYNYIKNQYDSGKSEGEIKNLLLAQGYTSEKAQRLVETAHLIRNQKKPNIKLISISAIAITLIIMIFTWLIVSYFYSENSTQESEDALLEIRQQQLSTEDKNTILDEIAIQEEFKVCTTDAWFCSSFEECSESGEQTRTCILEDTNCLDPDAIKPTTTQPCTPPIQEEPIVCNLDSDCDDNDQYTEDKCISPSTINAYCEYERCSDLCSSEGKKECSGNGYMQCGNYDSDPCIEWSSVTECSEGTTCLNGGCVEQNIPNIPYFINICSQDCENFPEPIFKVCPTENPDCDGVSESTIEISLDSFPLTTSKFYLTQLSSTGEYVSGIIYKLIEGKGVVYGINGLTNNDEIINNALFLKGTNKMKFIMGQGVPNDNVELYFTYYVSKLVPGQNLKLDYISTKISDSKGTIYLYKRDLESYDFTIQEAKSQIDYITPYLESLFGHEHIPYTIYLIPLPFAMSWEGNLYLGGGQLSINVGLGEILAVQQETSHEFTHALYRSKNLKYGYCFEEGLARAMTVHLGYEPNVHKFSCGAGADYDPDDPAEDFPNCLINPITRYKEAHNVGNNLFAYLYDDNVFSDSFFKEILTPTFNFDFNLCDYDDKDVQEQLLVLLSESSGKDLTNLIKNKVGLTKITTLEDAKQNIGFE